MSCESALKILIHFLYKRGVLGEADVESIRKEIEEKNAERSAGSKRKVKGGVTGDVFAEGETRDDSSSV